MARPRKEDAPQSARAQREEFAKQAEQRAVEAAEAATKRAEEEGRLPENAAITSPAPASAEDMQAGGAFTEKEIKAAIDVSHPAVENNPRFATSAVQNGQDWNDPLGDPADEGFVGQGLDMSVYGDRK